MILNLKTDEFVFDYMESGDVDPVLLESHCHAQFEMIAVLEGDVNVMLEGKGYHLKEGQTILIPPLCYHSITVNESATYRRVTALFDLGAIPSVLHDEMLKRNADAAISYSPYMEKLKELLEKEDPSFYVPLAKSLMVQLFYDCLRPSDKSVDRKTDAFLQEVIAYIDRHLNEKITLDDLSKYTSRSKSSFCHLFEDKMKISPKQYILQKKLALASKLISEGTPPTVAAIRIGYENYSDFYRLYVKHFGKAPTRR